MKALNKPQVVGISITFTALLMLLLFVSHQIELLEVLLVTYPAEVAIMLVVPAWVGAFIFFINTKQDQ